MTVTPDELREMKIALLQAGLRAVRREKIHPLAMFTLSVLAGMKLADLFQWLFQWLR